MLTWEFSIGTHWETGKEHFLVGDDLAGAIGGLSFCYELNEPTPLHSWTIIVLAPVVIVKVMILPWLSTGPNWLTSRHPGAPKGQRPGYRGQRWANHSFRTSCARDPFVAWRHNGRGGGSVGGADFSHKDPAVGSAWLVKPWLVKPWLARLAWLSLVG